MNACVHDSFDATVIGSVDEIFEELDTRSALAERFRISRKYAQFGPWATRKPKKPTPETGRAKQQKKEAQQ